MVARNVLEPATGFGGDLPAESGRVRAAPLDRAAAEKLLRQLLPRVRNLIRYLVRSDAEVDDIAQEALLELLYSLQKYTVDEGSFDAWVGRIVTRRTFSYLRQKQKGFAKLMAPLPEGVESLKGEGAEELTEYVSRRRFVRLLDQLSNEQREVVVLHYTLEMSVPEVAATVGAPAETVRSRLRLARARLRALGLELMEDSTEKGAQ